MEKLRNVAELNFRSEAKTEPTMQLDPRILSSIVVAVKVSDSQEKNKTVEEAQKELLRLTHSAPMTALLSAAETLAKNSGVTPQESLQQILVTLKDIDALWTQVLMKEGLARLSSQYH